jgi:hypothetical protein
LLFKRLYRSAVNGRAGDIPINESGFPVGIEIFRARSPREVIWSVDKLTQAPMKRLVVGGATAVKSFADETMDEHGPIFAVVPERHLQISAAMGVLLKHSTSVGVHDATF